MAAVVMRGSEGLSLNKIITSLVKRKNQHVKGNLTLIPCNHYNHLMFSSQNSTQTNYSSSLHFYMIIMIMGLSSGFASIIIIG